MLKAVKEAQQKAWESEQKRQDYLYGSRKERDEMYEQMRSAMLETQQHVEVISINICVIFDKYIYVNLFLY